METPIKYKSVPASSMHNRTFILLNSTQKAKVHSIIEKFIQYLKAKHS
jgi:hypothetical protein